MRIASKLIALTLLAAPAAAFAHPGHLGGHGFMAGVAHPLSGLDHLLAMLAVGIWAAQTGGRALWAVPAAFVVVMAAGGVAGAYGLGLPGVELGIAGSVVAFGLLIAASKRLPLGVGMALTAGFALFHGVAHGAELNPGDSLMLYGGGFLLATVGLHAAGAGLARLARNRWGTALVRIAGAGTAAVGAVLMVGLS